MYIPLQEWNRIVKSKHRIVILHIILIKEVVNFFNLICCLISLVVFNGTYRRRKILYNIQFSHHGHHTQTIRNQEVTLVAWL